MKRLLILLLQASILSIIGCGNSDGAPTNTHYLEVNTEIISTNHELQSREITIQSNAEWGISTEYDWIILSQSGAVSGSTTVNFTLKENRNSTDRSGIILVKSGIARKTITVFQAGKPIDTSITPPTGYKLAWHEEFNQPLTSTGKMPLPDSSEWYYENGGDGWGNNELQTYVAGVIGQDTLAQIRNGSMKIIAKKIGSTVNSVRINTVRNWKYGYFEARLKLPVGRGTWPAFWMMPANFTSWPLDGEIDIMEHVGYRPNWASSAIHCKAYHHSIGTEKTGEKFIPTAQSDFHIYALEWTEDYIRTMIDGEEIFRFANDKKGNKETWPFNAAFYLKLNLAWGGNWGGSQGVDESALPCTYEIDYVRVFQKE